MLGQICVPCWQVRQTGNSAQHLLPVFLCYEPLWVCFLGVCVRQGLTLGRTFAGGQMTCLQHQHKMAQTVAAVSWEAWWGDCPWQGSQASLCPLPLLCLASFDSLLSNHAYWATNMLVYVGWLGLVPSCRTLFSRLCCNFLFAVDLCCWSGCLLFNVHWKLYWNHDVSKHLQIWT